MDDINALAFLKKNNKKKLSIVKKRVKCAFLRLSNQNNFEQLSKYGVHQNPLLITSIRGKELMSSTTMWFPVVSKRIFKEQIFAQVFLAHLFITPMYTHHDMQRCKYILDPRNQDIRSIRNTHSNLWYTRWCSTKSNEVCVKMQ